MPKASPIITSFNAGEWSPKLEGRVQQEKYANACRTLENFIPQIHGGAEKRQGTRHVTEVKTSANDTILIPFEFSTTQAYVLEFGDQYMRVYRNNGQVQSGGSPYEIVTPYLASELADLYWAQSADILYVAHPNHPPRKFSRTADDNWTVTEIEFDWVPFLPENINPLLTEMYASAATGTGIAIVSLAAYFTADMVGGHIKLREVVGSNHDLWQAGTAYTLGNTVRYEGNVYECTTAGTSGSRPPIHLDGEESDGVVDWTYLHSGEGYAKITSFTSSTFVTCDVVKRLPTSVVGVGNPTNRWAIGAWHTEYGFPSVVTFHEDRLLWAGTTNNPQTIWGSQSGDYENHQAGVLDSDAYQYTLNSNQVNVIQWMTSGRVLLIGTSGGEFVMRASSLEEAITPTNVRVTPETILGSTGVIPVKIGNSTLFVQRSGEKVRELTYDFNSDSYIGKEMTLLSEHITRGGLTGQSYQSEPSQVIWYVRGDGVLVGFTYEKQEGVYAWHRHVMAGTNAKVKSVATIPHPDGDMDQTWMIVERTINGSTVKYVEYLEKRWERANDIEDAFFVDSGLTYDGVAATVISGLSHLEGETVTILADGATHADKTVSSGSITLDRSAQVVHVGLGYNATLETMRLEAGAGDGTAQGKTKRIQNFTLRLDQTGPGLYYGANTTDMDELDFRDSSMSMDTAVPLFDGDKGPLLWPGGYETEGRLALQHRLPLPCSVLALMPQLLTQDR